MPQDTRDKVVNALIELAEQNPEKLILLFQRLQNKLVYRARLSIKSILAMLKTLSNTSARQL